MLESQYLVLWATGFISLLFALGLNRWHEDIEVFATIALLAWGVLAYRADTISVVTQTGETVTAGAPEVAWFAGAMFLLSLFALIGAATGRWPVESNSPYTRS